MIKQEEFLMNLSQLRQEIADACRKCHRNPDDISLLPVTKNWPVEAVSYCQSAGLSRVGENRVQEARLKQEQIKGMSWELIGHLQSNKVNQVVGHFARIQTLDSLKLILKVQTASERIDQKTTVLLQVNTGKDPAKYGFSIEEAPSALDEILGSSHLHVDGLMTIAPYAPGAPSVARDCFQKLADLRDKICHSHGIKLTELSMGMSGDLKEAIISGSTMIRVGSALFGDRI